MPEFRYAMGRVMESLSFISMEMKEFDSDYASKTWQEYASDTKLQKLIDRTVENILTALIEVCGVILVEEDIFVESYPEVMRSIGKFFGLTIDESEALARLAILRNRLAHRYLNFRWQVIRTYKHTITLIEKLLAHIYEYELKRQGL